MSPRGRQVGERADESDESTGTASGLVFSLLALGCEPRDREAVLGVPERDPLDNSAHLAQGMMGRGRSGPVARVPRSEPECLPWKTHLTTTRGHRLGRLPFGDARALRRSEAEPSGHDAKA
jgi:hypothetical protein